MMLISIITINYNNSIGLADTIRSVISQIDANYEYIVIDGGSTDDSVKVIKQYEDKLSYWVSERDRGIYHAMNKGIEQATGDYCLFLNSGDTLYDNRVLFNIVHDLSADIVIGAIRKATSGYIKRVCIKESFVLLDFWIENPIPHQSTFIKRSICSQIRYDETLKIAGDLKFFLQAIVVNGSTCRSSDYIIANFDENGISSRLGADEEWKKIFTELMPPYLFNDYKKMLERNYDGFYIRLHLRKYYKYIYTISVLCVKLISMFRLTARFVRKYPLFIK